MRIVNEAIIETAIAYLLDLEKTVVEGAGAAGLATLLPAQFGGKLRSEFIGKKIGVILSGGNIDPRFLASVILGNLARAGKIGRIAIRIQDEVGALGRIVDIFTANDANIIEIAHQRIFGGASAKDLATEIEYEVRDKESGERLVNALLEAGYRFDRVLVTGERRQARKAKVD
jgi:threonine dehydratase